jgi:transposase
MFIGMEVIMISTISQLLNLPGVTVQGCSEVEGFICIHLEMTSSGACCPHCGKYSEERHRERRILIRDLPTFGQKVLLKVPRRQFYCYSCQCYFTEELEFLNPHRHHTKRYEENIYQRICSSTIEQISREENVSRDEIQGIFDAVYSRHQAKNWSEAKRLSIDEVAMHKGHKDFVGVVSDIDARTLLEVAPSNSQKDMTETLSQQPIEVRKQVKEVSVDMWGGYPKVIKEIFPNATIVFDRFHVIKGVNSELNRIRKDEGITDRGSKFILLKNFEDLSDAQEEKLIVILSRSETLTEAYILKEELREIYETPYNVEEGMSAIEKWLNKAQSFYHEATQTIRNHLQGICNYFISRATSGVMEGINNRIQLIKRQAYGFVNFNNFRSRLLACFS